MEKRLVKVAQELNVGTSTIVDYLNSHGFAIENKPTSKITEEMDALLHKEFSKSIAIKEQADSMTIGVRPILKKEISSTSKDGNVTTVVTPPPLKKEDLLPKTGPVFKKPEPPKPPVVVEEEIKIVPPPVEAPVAPHQEETPEEKPKFGLTIKGKLELDDKGVPVKETEDEEIPAKPVETPAEPPVAEKSEPEPQLPMSEPASIEEIVKEQVEQPAPEQVEEVEVQPEAGAGDELVRMETPELRGLKILGKIDINKRQEPKSKPKKRGEGGRPSEAGRGAVERVAPDRDRDNRDRGKSAPPQSDDRKPKPVASSVEDEEARKKRKRKRKKVTISNLGETIAAGGANKRKRSKEGDDKEVSKKEVGEAIRKTMVSMSGAGKKKGQKLRREKRERIREKQELLDMQDQSDKLEVTEFVTVQELANMMGVSASEVITTCMSLGVFVSINQRLDAELIELVASEFGHGVQFISVEEQTDVEDEEEDDPENLELRAPIVTVMGHVDHGKTSLLDHIRKANVVAGEAGGITQHIGAYEVELDGRKITFLDTPGHEAFTAMRARGTKVTDIAIIVIAADDNVMPQTKEAISHAQAANVPMVFAINKIDKAGAQPEKIKQELASMNLLVEDWGGTYQSQDISAKSGIGIEKLLEKVLLVADLAELKANPNRPAVGSIIEASLDKGKGYVAKILVQNGTLHMSDAVVAGEFSGKVKAMFNERGKRINEAGPSTPVLVLGLSGAPQAGEKFKVMEDESEARQLAARRAQINRELTTRATKRISLEEIGRRLALGTFKELNLIVKGDVDGSVEALSDSLIKLSIEKVQVNVIHRAVGQIVESDVLLASASDAIIIGFQVRPSLGARKLAEREGVEIKTYSIIYEAIEEIKLAIEGMLEPTKEEKIVCNIEVREVYKISKVGTVAGCFVLDGKMTRNTHVRVIRDGIVIYPTREGAVGELGSLKRFKDDVKEIRSGMECGLTIKNFNDIKAGDIVEGFEVTEVKTKYG
jgi:translation initiation factor IF-2